MTILSLEAFNRNQITDQMPDKLFVYGTLKPGEPMDHLLESIGGRWEKATLRGELIEAGSAPGVHYPGVILDESGDVIEGFLFISENLPDHWGTLDRYEGRDYQRVKVDVRLEGGEVEKAYVYEWRNR